MDGMFTPGLGGPGWSGVMGVTTGFSGTVGAATPAAAAPADQSGGASSCVLCNHPLVRQGVFFLAVLLLVTSWRAHLHSIME